MPSFIRPTSKIVMEEFSSWRPCLGCFHSSKRCSPTAVIKDRNLRKRLQKFCRISTLKSSNVPIRSAGLWSCPNAGSSSAPLPGSIAAAVWPRIGSASTEKRSRSCASPQSASCSENYAIRPEVSGRTLTPHARRATLYFDRRLLSVREGVSGRPREQAPRGSRFAPHRKLCPAHKLGREEFLRLLV